MLGESAEFDFKKIKAELADHTCDLIKSFEYFESIDSTNTYLMRKAGDIHGHLCMADFQTQGKGRRGKQWQSSAGSSLMFSLGWSPSVLIQAPLSLIVGVAVVDALNALGVESVTLKWPNDVLHNESKLAGILLESRFQGAHVEYAIGVGLNILGESQALNKQMPRTSLNKLGLIAGREEVLLSIILALDKRFTQLLEVGFELIRQDWLAAHAYQDTLVSFEHNGVARAGIIEGIDINGALQILAGRQLISVSAGEIHTLRRLQ